MTVSEFDYDVRERKQIARMAKYKKNGSKSKKCSLPSDGMTRKQWEKKNGEVKVINMNSPINWDGFKEMSLDTQKEYVNRLIEKFGLTYSALSQMFGCIPTTVRSYFKKNGFDVAFKQGKTMSEAQKTAWENFINGDMVEYEEDKSEEANYDSVEQVEVEPAPAGENHRDAIAENTETSIGTVLREFSLIFDGKIDPISVGNSIAAIIGTNATGRIEVRCVTA